MPSEKAQKTVWWGSFTFDEDDAGSWRVGPSTLWIHRSARSWRIIHSTTRDDLDDSAEVHPPVPLDRSQMTPEDPTEEADTLRFSFQKIKDREIVLTPALADRAVVIRPDSPLYVLAGEDITLFASTPVWIRIEAGSPSRLLTEIPSHRPSDTWFGPNAQEGELCYAVKTAGRLRLDRLPFRLHRAVTPVLIRNHASDALLLERIQIPVPYLSLYQGKENYLWTQSVTLERGSDGDVAAVRLDQAPPAEAGATVRLSGPRLHLRTNVIIRTFTSIFSR